MKVMVLVKASKDSEAGVLPSEQLLAEMGKFNQELVTAGILLSAEGLKSSSLGARVRFNGSNRTVIDGPFAETKELLAGFWLWQVKSMDEAIEWVKRCPNPMSGESEIEIRPVFSAEDFAPNDPSGELRAAEAQLRTETEARQKNGPRLEAGKELLIVGLKNQFTMQTTKDIPALWQTFVPHLGKIPGQVGNTSYGVCLSCTPEGGFEYMAGVEVADTNNAPAGFTYVRIPARRYAVFMHRGHVSEIGQAIQEIWSTHLPASGYRAIQSPSFERYTDDFNPQTGRGGMEIWVPIEG